MRRTGLILAALTLPLAACAADDSAATDAVPAGVAEQYAVLDEEVAERGGETTSGDWTVKYIVEAAEPWHAGHGGGMSYREPTGAETHHLEIIPVETETGRIVPNVPIEVRVLDQDGTVVDEQSLDFFHSTFFHYAQNFEVPQDGTYTLEATLGTPDLLHHGERGEQPGLAEGATVRFEDVELTTPE